MKDVSITLVNESCFSFLKELESNSIDLALIDPPYEVSRETNFKSESQSPKSIETRNLSVSLPFASPDLMRLLRNCTGCCEKAAP